MASRRPPWGQRRGMSSHGRGSGRLLRQPRPAWAVPPPPGAASSDRAASVPPHLARTRPEVNSEDQQPVEMGLPPELELARRIEDQMIARKLHGELLAPLRAEAAAVRREQAAADFEARNVLVDELEAHLCAICAHTMLPAHLAEDGRDHSPALLVPCGHNLCAACVVEYCRQQRKTRCPYCRGHIETQVPNAPLAQLIVRIWDSSAQRWAVPSPGAASSADSRAGLAYAQKWVVLHAQIRATELEQTRVHNQLASVRDQFQQAQRRIVEVQAAMEGPREERRRLAGEKCVVAERRAALEAELGNLEAQAAEAKHRVAAAAAVVAPLRQQLRENLRTAETTASASATAAEATSSSNGCSSCEPSDTKPG